MERITSIILLFVFILRSTREVLLSTFWWQAKEYRLDRLLVFLKTKRGKGVFVPLLFWVKLLIFFSLLLQMYSNDPIYLFVYLAGLAFLIEDCVFARELFERRIRKPVFTLRAKRIMATSGAFIFLVILGGYRFGLFLNTLQLAVLLLVLDKLIPLATFTGVVWTQVSVNRTKRREIEQAKQRLDQAEGLITIGITGSYGKTCTKEFLATILKTKFKIAATTGSENTEFGIARKIMANVSPETQVFIAEMGAYKKGEIARLANIVCPKIGIITGIAPQHLSLFGNWRNLLDAKYELISSLSNGGVAIFNGDNPYCLKLSRKKRVQKTIVYQRGKPKSTKGDILWANSLAVGRETITFRVHWKKDVVQFEANLLGEQFVEDILGACSAALVLGMSLNEIGRAVKTIGFVARTMEPKIAKEGFLVIDDSYSTNPHGFTAALTYLERVKFRKRFVVTPGIIELGGESEGVHKRLGQRLAKIADLVILTSEDFEGALRNGMGSRGEKMLVVEKNPSRVSQMLASEAKSGDAVLIEGRIPERLRRELIK